MGIEEGDEEGEREGPADDGTLGRFDGTIDSWLMGSALGDIEGSDD